MKKVETVYSLEELAVIKRLSAGEYESLKVYLTSDRKPRTLDEWDTAMTAFRSRIIH